MRKIFLIALLISATSAVFAQRYTPFTGFGFEARRLKADSVMLIPSDTTANKTGIVRRGSSLYVGDGTKWTQVQAGAILSDSVIFATRAVLYKVADSLGGIISTSSADSSVFSTKAYRQKGIDSVQANLTAGLALKLNLSDSSLYASRGRLYKVADSLGSVIASVSADSLVFSTKAYRQKGVDSVQANLIAGLALKLNISDTSSMLSPYYRTALANATIVQRITDSLRSLVRLRASGSGGIQLQNSVGTNVADFGTANTTNGSIAGGWNVGGNLAVTGTSGFTGKATFTDSIVGVNQRLSGNLITSNIAIGGTSVDGKMHITNNEAKANLILDNYVSGWGFLRLAYQGVDYGYIGQGNGLFTGAATSDIGLRGENNVLFGIGSTEAARFNSNRRLLINTTTDNGQLVQINGTTDIRGALTATAQGNNITVGVDSSVTSTSYTLVLGDAGYLKRCDNASAITITVPNNSSVAFPIGTTIYFSQKGAGKVNLSAASGVNLRSEGNLLGTAGQNAVIGIIKVNTNDFLVVGNRG